MSACDGSGRMIGCPGCAACDDRPAGVIRCTSNGRPWRQVAPATTGPWGEPIPARLCDCAQCRAARSAAVRRELVAS